MRRKLAFLVAVFCATVLAMAVQKPVFMAWYAAEAAGAGFGMLRKLSEYAGSAIKAMVRELAGKGVGSDPHGYRAEFVSLVEQADIR